MHNTIKHTASKRTVTIAPYFAAVKGIHFASKTEGKNKTCEGDVVCVIVPFSVSSFKKAPTCSTYSIPSHAQRETDRDRQRQRHRDRQTGGWGVVASGVLSVSSLSLSGLPPSPPPPPPPPPAFSLSLLNTARGAWDGHIHCMHTLTY